MAIHCNAPLLPLECVENNQSYTQWQAGGCLVLDIQMRMPDKDGGLVFSYQTTTKYLQECQWWYFYSVPHFNILCSGFHGIITVTSIPFIPFINKIAHRHTHVCSLEETQTVWGTVFGFSRVLEILGRGFYCGVSARPFFVLL